MDGRHYCILWTSGALVPQTPICDSSVQTRAGICLSSLPLSCILQTFSRQSEQLALFAVFPWSLFFITWCWCAVPWQSLFKNILPNVLVVFRKEGESHPFTPSPLEAELPNLLKSCSDSILNTQLVRSLFHEAMEKEHEESHVSNCYESSLKMVTYVCDIALTRHGSHCCIWLKHQWEIIVKL